ncbi:MAG: DHH family phosphoesterase [Myxococcales bacterium]|nr:DHH family phosphoesterase [Myxococcales bacterium]
MTKADSTTAEGGDKPGRHAELERVLRSAAGEPLVVLIGGHPDPDAIGCALAHQRLCEHAGVPATIAHVLPVSHRQNRALVKLLGIGMVQVTHPADLERFAHLSLVDASAPDPSILLPASLRILTVVDHHRGPVVEAAFVDVRPTFGASSTIYAEYLAAGFAPLDGHRDDARVATALFFGIQTDTDDFARATAADFAAAAYLRDRSDSDVLKRVGRRTVGATAMSVVSRALADLMVVRDFAVAAVGEVALADRDTIGAAADYLLQREDLDTVIAFGLVGDKIDGSLRTNSPSVEPQTFLGAAFGVDRDGRAFGGGRADKGAFQLPLGMLSEAGDRATLWTLARRVVLHRLARVVPDLAHELERKAPPGK